jgi:hypothetical protein
MRKEINPFINPLGYAIKREKETIALITKLTTHIPDKRIKSKAINFINKHRNALLFPPFIFENYYALQNDLSSWQRKYLMYCAGLFKICGLYSLEDEQVRFFVYSIMKNKDAEIGRSLEKTFLSIFSKQSIDKTIKRFKAKKMGSEEYKNILKAQVFYDKTVSGLSYRQIGKRLGINHKTVKNYYEVVIHMSKKEQKELLKAREHALSQSDYRTYSLPPSSQFDERKMGGIKVYDDINVPYDENQ